MCRLLLEQVRHIHLYEWSVGLWDPGHKILKPITLYRDQSAFGLFFNCGTNYSYYLLFIQIIFLIPSHFCIIFLSQYQHFIFSCLTVYFQTICVSAQEGVVDIASWEKLDWGGNKSYCVAGLLNIGVLKEHIVHPYPGRTTLVGVGYL